MTVKNADYSWREFIEPQSPLDVMMPKPPPVLAKRKRSTLAAQLGRWALISAGGTAMVSAAVNMAAAWWLIEPTDEQSLGITRTQILFICAAVFVLGAALGYLGVRRPKK